MATKSENIGDNILRLENVRLSYPALDAPRAFKGGPEKFSAVALIDKSDTSTINTIRAAIKSVAQAAWKDKAVSVLQYLSQEQRLCFRDGDKKFRDDGTIPEGYEGCMYLASSSFKRPPIIAQDGQTAVVKGDPGMPYGGCYVNILVRLWAQDNDYGKRVNAELVGVMFAGEGEPFGASPVDVVGAFAGCATEDEGGTEGDGSEGDGSEGGGGDGSIW